MPKKLWMVMVSLVKSTPPMIREMIGIMMSLTRELTIEVKAEPTTTPMARSMTLPRLMNSLNSSMNLRFLAMRILFCSLSLDLSNFSMKKL